jgi:hypothetical protein
MTKHCTSPLWRFSLKSTCAVITSLTGTLASNIARGSSLQVAVKNALYCATHSVQHPGAQKSYACSQDIPKEFRPPALSEFVFDKKWVLDSASDDELVSKSI